jgi:hypothetical protein
MLFGGVLALECPSRLGSIMAGRPSVVPGRPVMRTPLPSMDADRLVVTGRPDWGAP